MEKVLRVPQVLEQIGMGRAWLYAAVKEGQFPAGMKLGQRARGWTESSVQRWIADRADQG